jgi:hypothetical protein
VRVASDAPGVTLIAMPETPFVPEIPHASGSLRGVKIAADAVLPGDGYDRYVKPFRTIEDVHVFGATLGYVVRMLRSRAASRSEDGRTAIARALTAILAFSSLRDAPVEAAATHVGLAGAIALGTEELRLLDARVEGATDEEAVRWRRDRTLLSVAGSARKKRLEKAWDTLAGR